MFKRQSNREGGFTLIEMVIVIVVIGILMGVAFQSVSGFQQNARDTRRLADLKKTQTFLELYYGKCGHYPTTGACGTPTAAAGTLTWMGTTGNTLQNRLSEVVNASDVPDDPLTALNYTYRHSGSGTEYVIAADTERVGTNKTVTGTVLTVNCNTLYCVRN